MWAAILIQTIGAVDPPGKGPRKLPAPSMFVAIFAVWSVLQLMASGSLARGARAMSIVLLLVTIVLGPGGARLISLMSGIAEEFGTAPGTPVAGTDTSSSSGSAAGASTTAAPTNRYASLLKPSSTTVSA